MMRSSFRLLRVRGIEIGANWSYLVVFAIISASLARGFFPEAYPGLSNATYWVIGIVTSVLFVVCLLLHELGHAFRALKEGMRIEGITLWLLGGVAKFSGMFPSAAAEFRIAIAGPAVTLVIVGILGGLRWVALSFAIPSVATGVIDYLFQINLTLLVFNMIPALPLDGGRVLRSTLWSRRRTFLEATRAAARVSRLIAGAMIALGALLFLQQQPNGPFLALIGWFILQAGAAEVTYATWVQLAALRRDAAPYLTGPGGDVDPVATMSVDEIAAVMELERQTAPRQPRRSGVIVMVVLGIAVLGFLWRPPLVTFAPGAAFDVTKDITVTGVKEDRVDGKYLLTSVAVQQPNVYGLIAAMAQGKDVAPLSSVVPQDVDPEEYFEQQEKVFKEAQTTAAAAAAEAAGMDVEITGEGALIGQVVANTPASKTLRARDVVTAIDGEPIEFAEDLTRVIRSRPPGTEFTFTLKRGKREMDVKVTSRSGIVRGAPGIGIDVSTKDYHVDLPFTIKFRNREIGGPSAGLSYALAVYDLIERSDLARGRNVATTGTMDIDGTVGPIGGVEQKTVAAERAKADLFLVPEAEVGQVPKTDMRVVGVDGLEAAIRALRS